MIIKTKCEDFFIEENGFFTLFNLIDSDLFTSLFGELSNEEITIYDEYFLFKVGNYLIFNDSFTPQKLVHFCIFKCGESWKKLKTITTNEVSYNGKNYTEERITEVNAFDSTELVTSDKETLTHNENTDNEIDLMNKGINFNKENFLIDLIIDDVKNTILQDIECY